MSKKERAVKNLQEGPFHLAVVIGKKGAEAVTGGKIEIDAESKQKMMIDKVNGGKYGPDCIVPFFQKFQSERM